MAVEAIDGVRPETRRAIAAAVDQGGVVTATDLPYPGKRQVRERRSRARGSQQAAFECDGYETHTPLPTSLNQQQPTTVNNRARSATRTTWATAW